MRKNSLFKFYFQDGLYEIVLGLFNLIFVATTYSLHYGATEILTIGKIPLLIFYFVFLLSALTLVGQIRQKLFAQSAGYIKPKKTGLPKQLFTSSNLHLFLCVF